MSDFVTGLIAGLIVGVLVGLAGRLIDAFVIDPIKNYRSALANIRYTCRRYRDLLMTYVGNTEDNKAAAAAFKDAAAALLASRAAMPFAEWIARRKWMLAATELDEVDSRLHRLSSSVFGPSRSVDDDRFRATTNADLRFLADKLSFSLPGVTDNEVVQ